MGKRIPVTVCGTWYRTITECCNALGVRINTVYKKLQSDKSITLEQAIHTCKHTGYIRSGWENL